MKHLTLAAIALASLAACSPHDAAVQFNEDTNQMITNIIKPENTKVKTFQVNIDDHCQTVSITTLDNFRVFWDSAEEGCDSNKQFTIFPRLDTKQAPYTFHVDCENGFCKGRLYANKRDFKELSPNTILIHSKHRFDSTYQLLQEKRATSSTKAKIADANTKIWSKLLTKESFNQVLEK